MQRHDLRVLIFLLFIILTFYCYGAGMMDYFAIYEPWKLIDADDFAAFHQYQGKRIISIFVIPSAVMTLFNIATLLYPPDFIHRKWLVWSLIAYGFDWLFSFMFQIPLQLILETRKDLDLLDELLTTNWWRFAADTVQFGIVSVMVFTIFKKLLNRRRGDSLIIL